MSLSLNEHVLSISGPILFREIFVFKQKFEFKAFFSIFWGCGESWAVNAYLAVQQFDEHKMGFVEQWVIKAMIWCQAFIKSNDVPLSCISFTGLK